MPTRKTKPAKAKPAKAKPASAPRPVRAHPGLGELRFDADRRWWDGSVTWHGEKVRVRIERPLDVSAAELDRFAAGLAKIDLAAVRACATQRLYPVYDRSWRDDEQGPDVDEAGFAELLRPEKVVFLEGERACVHFDDGQLFAGHLVTVGLDAALRPDRAEMSG